MQLFSGPKLSSRLTFGPPKAKSLKHEYGELACAIELVSDLDSAINHIHTYGSGHTEVIVTENSKFLLAVKSDIWYKMFLQIGDAASKFQRDVDSACVFHNASSRFADGFRFGLGKSIVLHSWSIKTNDFMFMLFST